LRVAPAVQPNSLSVEFAATLAPVLAPLLARLRHLFDLTARPDLIAAHLGADEWVGPLIGRCPGLRIPGALSGFDLAWRTILGQRVSVRAATTVAGRLAAAYGDPIATPITGLNRLAPTPERLADSDVGELAGLGMPRDRALAVKGVARSVADGHL